MSVTTTSNAPRTRIKADDSEKIQPAHTGLSESLRGKRFKVHGAKQEVNTSCNQGSSASTDGMLESLGSGRRHRRIVEQFLR